LTTTYSGHDGLTFFTILNNGNGKKRKAMLNLTFLTTTRSSHAISAVFAFGQQQSCLSKALKALFEPHPPDLIEI
jgi:hypothetical protein